jgi:hypothetical protein
VEVKCFLLDLYKIEMEPMIIAYAPYCAVHAVNLCITSGV